jgi:hypothetical protein
MLRSVGAGFKPALPAPRAGAGRELRPRTARGEGRACPAQPVIAKHRYARDT